MVNLSSILGSIAENTKQVEQLTHEASHVIQGCIFLEVAGEHISWKIQRCIYFLRYRVCIFFRSLSRQVPSSLSRNDTRRNESQARILSSLLIKYVIAFSLIVGLMKGPVTPAPLVVISLFCDLADHCPHAINLNVFRASFDALLRRTS